MSKAKCIMVQGTMSGAGKSLLCAALCRIFAQDGYRVAPFKSQNMALNSFVTRNGAEMGRAQVVQAQAAGVEPDVRMNPILLKPSSDVGSQVIVNGKARGQMSAADYFRMKRSLIPDILEAYNSLAAENDIIVIEGAGSPAEINLKADDIVNMGLAKLVDAPVLLAGDIDRGGVFAQLYGTVELLEADERARIRGLIINKFRGDVEILRPGLAMLEEKTQLPVLGVVPYLRVEIEDEDSLSDRLDTKAAVKPLDIAILRLPHVSNFTDFIPLEQHPLLGVRYVQRTRQLGAPDLVILPGTKNTMDDLRWLRESGLEAAVLRLSSRYAGAGRVRRLSDAGRTALRPGRGGERHPLHPAGPWPAAHHDGVRHRKAPDPDRSLCDHRTLCRRKADGLRDPRRPHRGAGQCVLHPCRRHAGGLCAGRCIRYLPARPVRHRRTDRKTDRILVQTEGHRSGRGRAYPHGAVPSAAV